MTNKFRTEMTIHFTYSVAGHLISQICSLQIEHDETIQSFTPGYNQTFRESLQKSIDYVFDIPTRIQNSISSEFCSITMLNVIEKKNH